MRISILLKELLKRKEQIDNTIRITEEVLLHSPDGNLLVYECNGYTRFYLSDPGKGIIKKYLKKDDPVIRKLAEKKYARESLRRALKERKALEKYIDCLRFTAEEAEKVMPPEIADFIEPFTETDKKYLDRWKEKPYEQLTKYEEKKIFKTKSGEFVRSKSELIVADILTSFGIDYKYEKRLDLPGGVTVYPDFTIPDMPNRSEIYIELFGMMDNPEYGDAALKKINKYKCSGYAEGISFIPIFESSTVPLNIDVVNATLRPFIYNVE